MHHDQVWFTSKILTVKRLKTMKIQEFERSIKRYSQFRIMSQGRGPQGN